MTSLIHRMKKMTNYRFEVCTRCGRLIRNADQTCIWKGARWPCVPPSDNTVIEVNGLLIKTGDRANPVPILEDYYG